MSDSLQTSLTLIGRLCQAPTDQDAWDQFVVRYGKVLRHWCTHWGLQNADAEDVVQNILLELSRCIRNYEQRPTSRFRGWLKTVAHRAWYDYAVRCKERDKGSGDSAVLALLESAEAQESLSKYLDEECVREILDVAMERVRTRVEPVTWQSFALMTFDKLSGEQAAERLGVKPGSVFVARSRVRRLIEQEYRQMDEDGEDGA